MLVVKSDSCRKEGPVIALLHILRVKQSVTEGALQSCYSLLHGVGVIVHYG